MDRTNDMTEGRVSKKMLAFFFPMLFANILQQLYSVADIAIVGKGIGDNALAAVGIISTISLFIIGFSMGLTNGFSVVIAQSFGSANNVRTRKTVFQAVRLCIFIAVIMTAFSLIFLRKIIIIMNTDSLLLKDTLTYGYIIFGGLAVTIAYNLCSAMLRAIGDSTTPFRAILISSSINIILDIMLIFVFKTGIAGAAIATVSAQLISVIICITKIIRLDIMRYAEDKFSYDREICILLLKNGIPMALMNSVTAVGCMIVQSDINALGVDHSSAYSVCTKYLNLFMLPSITAGFTVSSFTGQNFGANKFDRIKEGVRTGLIITLVSYIILGLSMRLFSHELADFMLSSEKAAGFTADYLKILGFTLIGVNFIFVFRNAVQGMGCASVPMISGILEMLLRLAAVRMLIPSYDYFAVAYADAAAWAGALAVNIGAYAVLIKKAHNKR